VRVNKLLSCLYYSGSQRIFRKELQLQDFYKLDIICCLYKVKNKFWLFKVYCDFNKNYGINNA